MSDHASTIRTALPAREWEDEFTHEAHAALDALLAENHRLREAGDRLAAAAAQYLDTGRGDLDGAYAAWREALAGDEE